MTVATSRPARLQSLDGLRGVAALVVVVYHSLLTVPLLADIVGGSVVPASLAWIVNSPLHILWAGNEAVLVFFVLSGFVLTRAASSSTFNWKSYYPSRLVRLYLPVWAAVGFSVVLALLVPRVLTGTDSSWMRLHADPLTLGNIVQAVTLIAPTPALDSPLWSLRWEVLFSLLLPVYLLAKRFPPRLLITAAFALITICAFGVAVSNSAGSTFVWRVGFYLPVFLVGTALAFRYEAIARWAPTVRPLQNFFIAVGSVVLLTLPWLFGSASGSAAAAWSAGLTVAGSAGVVLLAITSTRAANVLERAAPRWLGRVSFSLYLVHEPIVVSVALLLPPSGRWATLFIALPVALLVAAIFYRFVESPSHRFSQMVKVRFADDRGERRAVAR